MYLDLTLYARCLARQNKRTNFQVHQPTILITTAAASATSTTNNNNNDNTTATTNNKNNNDEEEEDKKENVRRNSIRLQSTHPAPSPARKLTW